jgi:hypothetical protein
MGGMGATVTGERLLVNEQAFLTLLDFTQVEGVTLHEGQQQWLGQLLFYVSTFKDSELRYRLETMNVWPRGDYGGPGSGDGGAPGSGGLGFPGEDAGGFGAPGS